MRPVLTRLVLFDRGKVVEKALPVPIEFVAYRNGVWLHRQLLAVERTPCRAVAMICDLVVVLWFPATKLPSEAKIVEPGLG